MDVGCLARAAFVESATRIAWLPSTSKHRHRPTTKATANVPDWNIEKKNRIPSICSSRFLEIFEARFTDVSPDEFQKRHTPADSSVTTRRSPTSFRFNDDCLIARDLLARSGERTTFRPFRKNAKAPIQLSSSLKLKVLRADLLLLATNSLNSNSGGRENDEY